MVGLKHYEIRRFVRQYLSSREGILLPSFEWFESQLNLQLEFIEKCIKRECCDDCKNIGLKNGFFERRSREKDEIDEYGLTETTYGVWLRYLELNYQTPLPESPTRENVPTNMTNGGSAPVGRVTELRWERQNDNVTGITISNADIPSSTGTIVGDLVQNNLGEEVINNIPNLHCPTCENNTTRYLHRENDEIYEWRQCSCGWRSPSRRL